MCVGERACLLLDGRRRAEHLPQRIYPRLLCVSSLGFRFSVWGFAFRFSFFLVFGFRVVGCGFGGLEYGFWGVGVGLWALGFVLWDLGFVFWVLGFGFWVSSFGWYLGL